MITKIQYQGATGYQLENQLVSAVVLPDHGAKVASFVHKATGFELLFQNPKPTYEKAHIHSNFAEFEACGFDDAFPGVNKETVLVDGKPVEYPDHGEIWSSQFVAQIQDETLVLSFDSPLLGYHYEKSITLVDNRLSCQYRITNPTNIPIPAIWTCHCLVRHEEAMEIVLPQEARTLENVYTTDWLGKTGKIWDASALPYATQFPPHGDLKFEMVEPVTSGTCGYRYPNSGISATFHYDPTKLPYLGYWCTAGGFRGDWNCALEPSNGYFDDIATATKNGKCPILEPGDEMAFVLEMALSPLA